MEILNLATLKLLNIDVPIAAGLRLEVEVVVQRRK